MVEKKFKQVCHCKNCGNESEMAVCIICGNEAEIWLDI